MLGSGQLGVVQLGQGYAAGVVEPPIDVDVLPDLVEVTAGICTQAQATARLRSRVPVLAGVCRGVRVMPAAIRSRVNLIAGVASVVYLRVER